MIHHVARTAMHHSHWHPDFGMFCLVFVVFIGLALLTKVNGSSGL